MFRRVGEHVIHVRATDSRGATAQDDAIVTVRNRGPVASVSVSPAVPVLGADAVLDASSSYDPDGTIVRYEWDFDRDGVSDGRRRLRALTYRFARTGRHALDLRVTDDAGATSTVVLELLVANVAPAAAFTVDPAKPVGGQPGDARRRARRPTRAAVRWSATGGTWTAPAAPTWSAPSRWWPTPS